MTLPISRAQILAVQGPHEEVAMCPLPYAQAALLSHCWVTPPLFDSLVTDWVLDRLPILKLGTQCQKRAVVTAADKPAISFIASGGALSTTPVSWSAPSAMASIALSRVGLKVRIDGAAFTIGSQIEDVIRVEAELATEIIKEKIAEQLWTTTPEAAAPPGMVAFAAENPNGVLDGNEQLLSLDQLGCLRGKISPWSPSAPLAYVMNSRTFEWLERTARNEGTPVEYHRNDLTGVVSPYWGSFEILICDWISQEEGVSPSTTSVYLIRLGTGPDDRPGIEGVSILTPQGAPLVQATPLLPVGTAEDVRETTIFADIAFSPGSAGCAVARLENVLSA